MLEGIRQNEIIVGAYTHDGGICPMLAAHRAGGRTSAIWFARTWDRFASGGRAIKRPRRATERELRVLEAHLEASLLEEDAPGAELTAAIASHQRLVCNAFTRQLSQIEAELARIGAESERTDTDPGRADQHQPTLA
jgi:glutathione S-transferase